MKKSLLALFPLILILTACNGSNSFRVEFLDGISHAPGFDNESIPQDYSSIPYSYVPNSSYDVGTLNEVNLTFENIKESDSSITNAAKIKSYIKNDNANFEFEIDSKIKYFGTKNDGFAFLGSNYNDEWGEITFVTNEQIKNVVIKAKQYYYLKTAFNENALEIDQNVAIAVNDSGFIKLDKPILNEEQDSIINYTLCAFSFTEATNRVTLKAGKDRAIIEEISLYF